MSMETSNVIQFPSKQPTRSSLIHDLIKLSEEALAKLQYNKVEQEADLYSQFHRFVDVFLRGKVTIELPQFRVTDPVLNGIQFRWTPIGRSVMIYFFPYNLEKDMPYIIVNIITEEKVTTIITDMNEIEQQIATQYSLKYLIENFGIPHYATGVMMP